MSSLRITLIGGPTALIEIDGFRLLTDPTFDPPGDYPLPHVTLTKLASPALAPEQLGPIDAVLLSHDQHADNLDHSGRELLGKVDRVLTTKAGASRLGGHVEGLAPWDTVELSKSGRSLHVTATPARHGPAGIEPFSGDVIGFVVELGQRCADLHHRRYRLVRGRRRGGAPLQAGRGDAVRRLGANARAVPPHHGHQRRRRDRE